MKIGEHLAFLDNILDRWRDCVGSDFPGYRNHCCRVATFCITLSGDRPETAEKVCIAAAFHDLGIWIDQTFDYLAPSRRLACEFLQHKNRAEWRAEIEAMIEQHHKITGYRQNPGWLVEPFRKADWIDVTKGWLTFGVPSSFVFKTMAAFPNAGFHKRLGELSWARLKKHPFSPLPMMRL